MEGLALQWPSPVESHGEGGPSSLILQVIHHNLTDSIVLFPWVLLQVTLGLQLPEASLMVGKKTGEWRLAPETFPFDRCLSGLGAVRR